MRRLLFVVLIAPAGLLAQGTMLVNPATLISQITSQFSRTSIQSVELNGTVERHMGSDEPPGRFSYRIKNTGEKTVDLDMGASSQGETTGAFGDFTACRKIDSTSNNRVASKHNCSLPLDWALPVLGLQSQLSTMSASLSETKDAAGLKEYKLSLERLPIKGSTPAAVQLMKHVSHLDFEIDPASLLLKSLSFTEHPEEDASLDFPVEIRYSDYRDVNGARIPFHIQKYLRGGLVLDFQVASASIQ